MAILVLGAGIVGSACAWDLRRRGHDVTVADVDREAVDRVADAYGATSAAIDASSSADLAELVSAHDIVVSAIPYRHGYTVASVALAAGTHHLDFGGNPAVVAAQRRLHDEAEANGVMIVPDCGLAPGLANVLAEDLIATADEGPIDSIQIQVGALPREPVGALGYQLAFSPAGLINEYAEPCEVLVDGRYATVEPLSAFEEVAWPGWGPLEAFATSGGTSTMCHSHEGRVRSLSYKTLRYPGHGHIFRALFEMGMFDDTPHRAGGIEGSPRSVLIGSLDRTLPRDAPDVVLVRVWRDQAGVRTVYEIEDGADGEFSALARTTAFPATALAHLIAEGTVSRPGVRSMHDAVTRSELMPMLAGNGIAVDATAGPVAETGAA